MVLLRKYTVSEYTNTRLNDNFTRMAAVLLRAGSW